MEDGRGTIVRPVTKNGVASGQNHPKRKGALKFMSEAVTEPNPNAIPTPNELGFDPAELRQKYAAERAKRLRQDGNNQYQEITGALEHYNADPYVKLGFTRP